MFDALEYGCGDRSGDSIDRVDTRFADGGGGLMGVIPVLPNPPWPLGVSEMTVVVLMSG